MKGIAIVISFLMVGLTAQPLVNSMVHEVSASSCCASGQSKSCDDGEEQQDNHPDCQNKCSKSSGNDSDKEVHHGCADCNNGHCTCSICAVIVLMHPSVSPEFHPRESEAAFYAFSNTYMFTPLFSFFHPPVEV